MRQRDDCKYGERRRRAGAVRLVAQRRESAPFRADWNLGDRRIPRSRLITLAIVLIAIPAAPAVTTIFQITSFSNQSYPGGFSGTVGATTAWPSEMGWQGDRIDIAFACPAAPATARQYRFRILVAQHFTQTFDVAVLAGPDLDDLVEVQREFVDSQRYLIATIPAERFTPGQTNYLRIQGDGVAVGAGNPPGIAWSRWLLTRTDFPELPADFLTGQLQRASYYTANATLANGLVRDAIPYSPLAAPFHPATPDAAGFALVALAVADHFNLDPDAEARALAILSAYSGHTAGVAPARNALGCWRHWLDINTGGAAAGWPSEYTTIGSAILVSGALFAKNHFHANPTIAEYAGEMRATLHLDPVIHPSLDGRVAVATDAAGNATGWVVPWNEYMLCVSVALRESGAVRAPAIAAQWLVPANLPIRHYPSFSTENPTLTDDPGAYAPAFWVHQSHFLNADFSTAPEFEALMASQQRADRLYCGTALTQTYRYGLTAGVSPGGYFADAIFSHHFVFSPEAAGAWGDIGGLLEFAQDQPPLSNPSYRYGLVRVSSTQPAWIPTDAALVDHLFLMFGIAEYLDPRFFKQRQAFQTDADADGIADAFDNCPGRWNPQQDDDDGDGVGDACNCHAPPADFDGDGDVDLRDIARWQALPAGAERWLCLDSDGDHSVSGAERLAIVDCLRGPDMPADCE